MSFLPFSLQEDGKAFQLSSLAIGREKLKDMPAVLECALDKEVGLNCFWSPAGALGADAGKAGRILLEASTRVPLS